jgi:hypothetical protein
MAKILYSALVSDMRNKLNGSVMSKNRYGAYIRNKVTPVNPSSTDQQNSRNILSTHSQGWRGLTAGQRLGWINGASNFPIVDIFGNVKFLAGNALYVRLNSNLNYANMPAISDCPLPVEIPALETLTVFELTAAHVRIAYTPTPVPADFALIIRATPNMSPSVTFIKNRLRNVLVVAAAGASPAHVETTYMAKYGVPVVGQQITFTAFFISTLTGQAGIPLQVSAVVA